MSNHRFTDNILATGEEMTLGGRLHASRQNSGMSCTWLQSAWGEINDLKSWENDQSEPRINKLVVWRAMRQSNTFLG